MQKSKLVIQKIAKVNSPQAFTVGKNEHLTLILTADEAADYRTEIRLEGEGAEADILGIMLGNGSHQIKINTLQDHRAPNTRSNLFIKSALSGRSRLFFEGFIKVEKVAQKTDAYQRNENLMLSTEAKIESKPVLEILANDVRCTHGTTIGKVDPEQLFYLQSRGIDVKTATALIIEGFFQSVIDKITDEDTKRQMEEKIATLLR